MKLLYLSHDILVGYWTRC